VRSILLAFFSLLLLQATIPAAASAQDAPRCDFQTAAPIGSVAGLEATPHLWILGPDGFAHWAGDTRALAAREVRWDSRCTGDQAFFQQVQKGDPWLSTGLVKIGDPIYLAKWETEQLAPVLLHVQSISDVELFGINASNYGQFVLDRNEWQQRYGFNTDILRRDELPAAVAPRAPPPPAGALTSPPRAIIDPPADDTRIWCLPANPSCGRDPWWVEWNELQSADLVEYRFAPGLVSEARYIEAIWLLWQWPQGKDLLREAGSNNVRIVTVEPGALPEAYASYSPFFNRIRVSRDFTEVSTWMLTDVLAHELKHASDDLHGLYQTRTYDDCITVERRAYIIEAQFTRWLSARMGGLPTTSQVANRLSQRDRQLFANIQTITNAPDPGGLAAQDYRQACTAFAR
jgi:hypothetical protein